MTQRFIRRVAYPEWGRARRRPSVGSKPAIKPGGNLQPRTNRSRRSESKLNCHPRCYLSSFRRSTCLLLPRRPTSQEGTHMRWIGPYTIDELLTSVASGWENAPPESCAVYLVSRRSWADEPTLACEPLYVGGNTGDSERFRTRIGDLVADLFGFYGCSTGHHSGGRSLNQYCRKNRVDPRSLFIGWTLECTCGRCGEVEFYEFLQPQLNRKRPSRCPNH